jgi:2-desacetyl-2-hydroxyethyl bacteriochlorophyllide A dehydrogenase
MGSVVSFTAERVVEVIEEPEPALQAGEVRVRTLFSGISAGTELAGYRGSSPNLTKTWNPQTRLFEPGGEEARYPLTGFGYEEVGQVVEVGEEAHGVSLGDRVWGTWGHRTTAVLPAPIAAARILDPAVDPRIGIFSHIGAVALTVVLDADIHVGETVVVFGLGVPGQLIAQLARLNGGRVVVVDGVAARRALALELGADVALDPGSGSIAKDVRELTDGRGADVVLEMTGNYRALQEAIRSVAYNSRVCVGGFFQGDGAGLNLGEEFHHNRVQLVGSQISGVPPHLQHRWDRYRLTSTAIRLAVEGRLAVTPLITDTVRLDDVASAYRMLDEQPDAALQVVIDMSGDAPA